MNIKSKIIRRRSGKSKDRWVIRIEYFDEILGRPRHLERHADLRTEAKKERDRLIKDLEKTRGQVEDGNKMTFTKLARICERVFYHPAKIHRGKKVSGIKSYKTVRGHIKMLEEFFGSRLIRHITAESLNEYRLWRIAKGSQRGNQRREISLVTINRELSTLRKMMNYALVEKQWLVSPLSFKRSIDKDAEKERTRRLSPDEELRLLSVCQGERSITYQRTRRGKLETITARHKVDNPHLKAILLLGMDSGLRKNEVLRLSWDDFDFEQGLVTAVEQHTKTEEERLAPLSSRTIAELQRIKPLSLGGPPFPFNSFDGSFETAKKLAGVKNLVFHDLRRTAIHKWTLQGTPLAIAGKAAGHSQVQTTFKHYLSVDAQTMVDIARNMDAAYELNKAEPEAVGSYAN